MEHKWIVSNLDEAAAGSVKTNALVRLSQSFSFLLFFMYHAHSLVRTLGGEYFGLS